MHLFSSIENSAFAFIWKVVLFSINPVKYKTRTGVLMTMTFCFPVQQIVLLLLKFLALDNRSQQLST